MNEAPYILLVDDDRQVVKYLRNSLVEGGYTVKSTPSGQHALNLIAKHMPDLLVLDLNMSEPDGFDLLVAKRSRFPYLRILVISGYLHGALLKAAKALGAIETLEKPVEAEVLVAKVREVLGR